MSDVREEPDRRLRTPWALPLALVIVAALVVGGVVAVAVAQGRGEPGGGVTADGGPLDLATVTPAVASHYRFAEDHTDLYAEVPCYCGCEDFLGHRHLADCFLLADGTGYEPHASGCGVCLAESAHARQLLADGVDPADVPAAVIARFGGTPPTAPTAPTPTET